MRTVTLVVGALLILLGPLFFLTDATHSPRAFIPVVFGILILICGLVATTPKKTKIAMHISVVVALLAFIGSTFSKGGLAFPKWIAALSGSNPDSHAAFSQMLIFFICGFYLVRSVLWFLGNRAARRAA